MRKLFVVLSMGIVSIAGCKKDNAQDAYPNPVTCDTANVTYAAVVKPIINSKCAVPGCHVNFSEYANLSGPISSGKLLAAIKHTGANPMPKGQPKLDDCSIAKIEKWIHNGAPNN